MEQLYKFRYIHAIKYHQGVEINKIDLYTSVQVRFKNSDLVKKKI